MARRQRVPDNGFEEDSATGVGRRRGMVFRAGPFLAVGLEPSRRLPVALASALELLHFDDSLDGVVVDVDDSSRRI